MPLVLRIYDWLLCDDSYRPRLLILSYDGNGLIPSMMASHATSLFVHSWYANACCFVLSTFDINRIVSVDKALCEQFFPIKWNHNGIAYRSQKNPEEVSLTKSKSTTTELTLF